jgi:hypothetical protein
LRIACISILAKCAISTLKVEIWSALVLERQHEENVGLRAPVHQETARGDENLRFRSLFGTKGRISAVWDIAIGQGLLTFFFLDVYPIAMAIVVTVCADGSFANMHQ